MDSSAQQNNTWRMAARACGVLGALGSASLWLVFAFLNPYGTGGVTVQTYVVAAVMVLLGLGGAAATLKDRPLGMLAASAASILPVGFYLLLTPGLFRWIGAFNLLLFAAGLMMVWSAVPRRGGSPRK